MASYIFKILRFSPKTDSMPHFEQYRVELDPSDSVLEGILKIQDEIDPSLAFRYSCRGAVCGSCAMVINGKFNLACRSLVKNIKAEEIVLEPLPNLEIVKDLMVDLQPFWKAYEKIKPYLIPKVIPEKENLVRPKEEKAIDNFINCVLCACCYGSCPVVTRDEKYLGPAALAKLFRFAGDIRDKGHTDVLDEIDTESGTWGCDTVFKCVEACPKKVRPTDGIEALRRKTVIRKSKRLIGVK
ncbi:MAG: succinate dehydrogenase iron-sulfur subunit [Candidatus Omnitrophota bacterium]|nr:succinate dehydrogenase iron-sulfur subunit [Candidatus Omnitrophota bacterium]